MDARTRICGVSKDGELKHDERKMRADHAPSPVDASLISRSKPSPKFNFLRSTIATLRSATLRKSPSKERVSNSRALLKRKWTEEDIAKKKAKWQK